jgi:hypothetical protein
VNYGAAAAQKAAIVPNIGDDALLDIIYDEIIAKRDNVSKSEFLADADYSKAYLGYVKDRLSQFQAQGLSTQEALKVYFQDAPLVMPWSEKSAERRKAPEQPAAVQPAAAVQQPAPVI